jgi:hypothetical protein
VFERMFVGGGSGNEFCAQPELGQVSANIHAAQTPETVSCL